METKYQSCAETAKILRQALKEAFPGVKFSVRSHTYSMGASIRVRWANGPTRKQVQEITNVFEGATFDGMTDYKGGKVHEMDGQPVHFGADFIFEERETTAEYEAKCAKVWESLDGKAQCELLNGVLRGSPYWEKNPARALAQTLAIFTPQPSKTAAAVKHVRSY